MSPNLDAQSQKTLAPLYPPLIQIFSNAADILAAEGTHVCFFEGFRSGAQQNADYAQGRTTPGHQITKAKAGQSFHQYYLAVDAAPYKSGRTGLLNWSVGTPQYQAFLAAMRKAGADCGADWPTLKDSDHFQLPGLGMSPSAAMQADYHNGAPAAIATIWARVASGVYKR